MIAFEVSMDGQKQCTAGVSDVGVASVTASWVRRASRDPTSGQPIPGSFEEELTLDVGGLTHDPDGASVHVRWLQQPLKLGQQITLAIVETEEADPPQTRQREDPTWVKQRQREYYERLKREYEPTSSTLSSGMTENKRTVDKYMDGFRRSDHAQILSCLTDDIEWEIPGAFHLIGKDAFDKEIGNEAFVGSPTITVTRMTEENDVVVAEGAVRTRRKGGDVLSLRFCDVLVMQAGKIKRLTSYLSEVK